MGKLIFLGYFKLLSFFALVFLGIVMLGQTGCSRRSSVPADLILRNGTLYTVNEAMPSATSLAVRGNKIIAVCRNDHDVKIIFPERGSCEKKEIAK